MGAETLLWKVLVLQQQAGHGSKGFLPIESTVRRRRGRTQIRKTRKGEKSSSPSGSSSDPRSADQQLDDELRKAQQKSELEMNEAAEQHDENNALKAECAYPLYRDLNLMRREAFKGFWGSRE